MEKEISDLIGLDFNHPSKLSEFLFPTARFDSKLCAIVEDMVEVISKLYPLCLRLRVPGVRHTFDSDPRARLPPAPSRDEE